MATESEDKMYDENVDPSILTHGLHHVLHLSCEDPVRYMTCGEGAAGFATLHSSGHVQFYHPDGHRRDLSFCQSLSVHFAGLISTHLPDKMVGWGPGATLTLLDAELNPLIHAVEPMDVRVCKILEHSNEIVTAGMGNVCVWCLTHLECRKRVTDRFGRHVVFTHLALLPSRTQQGCRAAAAYGRAVVVVDLTDGCIVEHKKNLHLREITEMVYCPLKDVVVTASDMTIRVWGTDWELQMAFVGHTALITSLAFCPVSGLLLSSSLDGTVRCWRPDVGDQVQSVSISKGCSPPLFMGGPDSAGTFCSYSSSGVDFWTISSIYYLHCKLGVLGCPVRQISTPLSLPSFPACAVCIHGNSDVTLVATETGEVLTRFQTNERVRCADYCVFKKILLVLNEEGVIYVTSTLTSPVTILDKWRGIEDWDCSSGQVKADIGTVCCMVLYRDVTDKRSGQQNWRSLIMQKVHKSKKIKQLDDGNRLLVILGHRGGCLSVLNMQSSKVQFRTSAHNQNISSMQAHPKSGYLLTAGEDKALLVWSVFPNAQPCLKLRFKVLCDYTPVLLALMGTQLTLTLENSENDTHCLMQYNLETQSRFYQEPFEEHHNKITGLCACHRLGVFASSSEDGTIRIWNMENRLLRVLELNAEPECLAYCQESGDLLLGITGNLYRIPHTHLLPPDHTTQKCDPDSELPKSAITTTSHTCRMESCHAALMDETEDFKKLVEIHKDLESLKKGDVECRGRKPTTIETKREAFRNYLRLIYKPPPDINIPEEDMFDVLALLFPPILPEPPPLRPLSFTDSLSEGLHSPKTQSESDEVELLHNEAEEEMEKDEEDLPFPPIIKTPSTQKSPPSPPPMEELIDTPLPPNQPLSPPLTPPPEPAPPAPPIAPPLLALPSPSPPTQPPPLPPPPSSCAPKFLQQFVDEQWFQDMYPNLTCISSSLGPEEFSTHLLDFMAYGMAQKNSIINALLMLIEQKMLDKQSLCNRLLVCIQNRIHKNMKREEQHFVGELLNLLVHLSPDSFETAVELLAVLANKKVDLKALVLCALEKLGVEEAELWLCPELDCWNSLTIRQFNQHKSLRDMAGHWLLTWTRKYKMHCGLVSLRSEGEESVSAPAEVIKYFCSVQRGKHTRAPPPPAEDRKDAVMVPSDSPRLNAIQRLGETHSMSRIRDPRGCLLPPLPSRPVLMGFPRFLSLPMAHVSVSRFPLSLDYRNFRRPTPLKYFSLERSYVEYYR